MNCPKCKTPAAAGALFCAVCGTELPETTPADLPSLGDQPTIRNDTEPVSMGDLPTLRETKTRRFKAGEKLMGRYRVLGELGQGGMGVVYRCLDEVGGIEVALKALPPELSHNSGEMEEVRENFQLVCKLAHPHIATVRTLELDAQTGNYYLILELVEGVDLRKWRKQQRGKVRLDQALPILSQIAQALDYAHSRKIMHRDIKPGNVMVAPDGTVKVLDFGLAAQIQSSLSRVSRVHFSTSGTGTYMSPEQWRGQRQDGATDQYALAVMAYELLSGHLPFEVQDQVALRESVLREPAQQPEGMADDAWAVLARALAKEPAQRFASCGEFIAALGSSRGDAAQTEKAERGTRNAETIAIAATRQSAAISDTPDTKSEVGGAPPRRRKGALVTAALLLLLAGGGGWYFGVVRPQQAAADQRQAEQARKDAEAKSASEAQAKAENEVKEKARLEAEVKQAAANNAKAEAEQQRLAAEAKAKQHQMGPAAATKAEPWTNTLGQVYVPVPGTHVLFCIWDTRVRDYREFLGQNRELKKPTFYQDDNHPVVFVSWDDATKFCEWLTAKERLAGKIRDTQRYRLPKDAEWNVAVGSSVYPWGDNWGPPPGAGNYCDITCKTQNPANTNVFIEGYDDGYAGTSPVGSFKMNEFRLYDMGGNVWQWSEDWYDPAVKNMRTLRGGAWTEGMSSKLLSSFRGQAPPDVSVSNVGFRCVLELDQNATP